MREPHTYAMTASTGDPAATASTSDSPTPQAQGDIPADTFGARLVLARYHAGRLSIEKAAAKCGLNSGNWVRWEDGALPRDKVEVAQAVSDGLGINREWLLWGGPLLSSRGGLAKRPPTNTVRYLRRPVRPIDSDLNNRPCAGTAAQPVRARRVIDRSQPVAA